MKRLARGWMYVFFIVVVLIVLGVVGWYVYIVSEFLSSTWPQYWRLYLILLAVALFVGLTRLANGILGVDSPFYLGIPAGDKPEEGSGEGGAE